MQLATMVPDDVTVLSVGELTQWVKELIEKGFPCVWVSGEVSNLSKPRSGHIYLSLKDSDAQMRAVIWRGIALRMRFDLQDGMELIARGRMTVYSPRGDYQLVIEEVQPKGIGALELALRQLREKLLVLGYFDPAIKKSLPRLPRRIALVTSATGAAVRDMIEILGRRWPAAEVWVCPVTVQGEGTGEDVAGMIRRLNVVQPRPDLMIVGRGGGSIEDLWGFNEEVVAHAIHRSKVPVVSAVGHETDVTIADLVADVRAATPSEAAELVVPNRDELLQGLFSLEARLKELLLQKLSLAKEKLDDLAQRTAFRLPLERVRELEERLDDWEERLHRATRQRILNAQQLLEAAAGQLQSLSPLNVLSRGYSLTKTLNNKILCSAKQTSAGDQIITVLAEGQVTSRVENVEE
ncbi:MAG: exodeoxyribonuclease VII large subunit [Gemmataceae bacterium]